MGNGKMLTKVVHFDFVCSDQVQPADTQAADDREQFLQLLRPRHRKYQIHTRCNPSIKSVSSSKQNLHVVAYVPNLGVVCHAEVNYSTSDWIAGLEPQNLQKVRVGVSLVLRSTKRKQKSIPP